MSQPTDKRQLSIAAGLFWVPKLSMKRPFKSIAINNYIV
jgi:hypothetical protein